MPERIVNVVYRKYDGSLHWHLTMRYLGEDEHGVWTGMTSGGSMRRGAEQPVTLDYAHVGLFPRDAWWTAWFNGEPRHTEVYCDITTVPQWTSPETVTMIDLDLDVIRERSTGLVHLVDEDEFADHQAKYGYPAEVIESAERSARWLKTAVGDGSEPFASAYQFWLAKVC
jgi:protein associated with RNAse G/E